MLHWWPVCATFQCVLNFHFMCFDNSTCNVKCLIKTFGTWGSFYICYTLMVWLQTENIATFYKSIFFYCV